LFIGDSFVILTMAKRLSSYTLPLSHYYTEVVSMGNVSIFWFATFWVYERKMNVAFVRLVTPCCTFDSNHYGSGFFPELWSSLHVHSFNCFSGLSYCSHLSENQRCKYVILSQSFSRTGTRRTEVAKHPILVEFPIYTRDTQLK
jgi:hypothetical protein